MDNEKINILVKDSITDALLILLNKKTLDRISITEITSKAGVGRVSFYRNFNSKEDIIDKYLTKVTDNFINKSQISFRNDNIEKYLLTLFTHLENYKDFAYNLYKSNCIYLIESQFKRIFTQNYKEYDKYKRDFYIGGIYNIYYNWLINGCKESPKELSIELKNLFVI